MALILEIVGPYGPDGWQDPETGTEYFNDTVMSDYGEVGMLSTRDTGDGRYITRADPVVLIAERLMEPGSCGTWIFELRAENGYVSYIATDEPIQWWDRDEPDASLRLARRAYSGWTPVEPEPTGYTSTHDVTVLKGDGA